MSSSGVIQVSGLSGTASCVAASEAQNSRRAVGSVPDRSSIGSLSDRCTGFSRGPGVVGDNAFSVHFNMRMDGYLICAWMAISRMSLGSSAGGGVAVFVFSRWMSVAEALVT